MAQLVIVGQRGVGCLLKEGRVGQQPTGRWPTVREGEKKGGSGLLGDGWTIVRRGKHNRWCSHVEWEDGRERFSCVFNQEHVLPCVYTYLSNSKCEIINGPSPTVYYVQFNILLKSSYICEAFYNVTIKTLEDYLIHRSINSKAGSVHNNIHVLVTRVMLHLYVYICLDMQ